MDNFDPTLISIVMPCHNAAPYVGEAIESVLQRYRKLELIIVEDGSTYGSDASVDRLSAGNPDRIVALHQPNSGPYAARNPGLARARGNFIAFLDADDYWHPDALARLHAAITETLADVAHCGRMLAARPGMTCVPHALAFYRRYPRGDAHIPRWRQVFDAVAVREHFARRHPSHIKHLGRTQRDALIYGTLLPEAYRCNWRRDTDSSRRLFRLALRKVDWKARDAKYIVASFLPAFAFDRLIQFVDTRHALKNSV